MSPLRRKIAPQLVMAQQTAAILTTFNECDMSEVQALRAQCAGSIHAKERPQTRFHVVLHQSHGRSAQSRAPPQWPHRRRRFYRKIISTTSASLSGQSAGWSCRSCATRTKKPLPISSATSPISRTKARDGKIKIEDLQGGTFTISNGGVYGSLMGTPILNPPQSGILGMHKIMERAGRGERRSRSPADDVSRAQLRSPRRRWERSASLFSSK